MPQNKCPKCGAPIEPGAQFCGNCGQKIASGGSAPIAKTLFMGSGAVVMDEVAKRLAQQGHPKAGAISSASDAAPSTQTPAAFSQPSPAVSTPEPAQPAAAQVARSQPSVAPAPKQPDNLQQSGPVAAVPAPGPTAASTEGPMARLKATGSLVGLTLNNRYEVLDRIGEGGFGTIYLAKQLQMDRQVALKVLNPYMSDDPKLVERFRREAKAACNLRDPHTIITYDFDQTPDGVLYLAMEYLQGKTLFEILEELGGLTVERTISILSQCCSSLAEAHAKGIVHRDIKPENIFLENRPGHTDYVKILDFGIAKIVSGDAAQSPALTAAGQTLGTLEYMSPEQLTGKPLDGRSDIYALGILAYEMLTGRLPFESDNPASIISGHLRQQPLPPSQVAPEANIPQQVDEIILKMLAKNRDERYPDAESLKKDLDALIRSSKTLRALMEPEESDSGKISPLWIGLAAVAVIGALIGILFLAGVF